MKGNNSRYATSQVLCTVCSTQYVPMFCLLGLERNYITHKPEWDRSDKQTDVEAESFEAVAKERRGLGYKRPVAPPPPPPLLAVPITSHHRHHHSLHPWIFKDKLHQTVYFLPQMLNPLML